MGDIQSLYDRVPPGLVEMVGIQGLGPKRARILSKELDISSIESLKSACENNLVASLQGFGEKSQQRYLEGIELFHRNQGRTRLDVGLRFGLALEKRISDIPESRSAQLAGSARRRRETIGDLDIVVATLPEHRSSVIQSIPTCQGLQISKATASQRSASSSSRVFWIPHSQQAVLTMPSMRLFSIAWKMQP